MWLKHIYIATIIFYKILYIYSETRLYNLYWIHIYFRLVWENFATPNMILNLICISIWKIFEPEIKKNNNSCLSINYRKNNLLLFCNEDLVFNASLKTFYIQDPLHWYNDIIRIRFEKVQIYPLSPPPLQKKESTWIFNQIWSWNSTFCNFFG